MQGCKVISLLLGMLFYVLASAVGVQAGVGRFIQVQGRVDLLKGGELPATPVEVYDEVETGDVVRTKSSSRAQIQFVDDTMLTIGPESRVAVEKYLFDSQKNQREAVLNVFMGLVKTAVTKLYQLDKPDFILKTHTAVMGVRGTRWLTHLLPHRTDIFVYEAGEETGFKSSGLEVRNLYPEIIGRVLVKTRQYVQVGMNLPPTPPVSFSPEDVKPLENRLELLEGSEASDSPFVSPYALFSLPRPNGQRIPPIPGEFQDGRTQVQDLAGGLYVPPRLPPPVSERLPGINPDLPSDVINSPGQDVRVGQ